MSEYKLIGHESTLENFLNLYSNKMFPNKILLSGMKGIGKSLIINYF